MDFEIIPLIGAGELRFGMTPIEIRRAMGSDGQSFVKSADSAFPTDAFLNDSVHVFYKPPGNCEAIEFYEPSSAIFRSTNLLGEPYAKVKRFLFEFDSALEEDEYGLTAQALGIGIYAPMLPEHSEAPVEAVIVFAKGYYADLAPPAGVGSLRHP